VGLAIITGFSGLAFAGGDGTCSYQQQAKQVATEKSDAGKSQAEQNTAKSDMKSEADRFVMALDKVGTHKPVESQQK
jgi:hypothetical protein